MKSARLAKGLTQRRLSEMLQRPHNYMSRVESLERHVSAAEFMVIARALKVRPATLMARAEKR